MTYGYKRYDACHTERELSYRYSDLKWSHYLRPWVTLFETLGHIALDIYHKLLLLFDKIL